MRLLNVNTMQLEMFNDCRVAPHYAILSHTWGAVDEEISFQDFENVCKNKIDSTDTDSMETRERDGQWHSLKEKFAKHPTKKLGWAKIDGACRQVMKNKLCQERIKCSRPKSDYKSLLVRHSSIQHIWIDTCCIDKSSSSELQEAINSMFSWYQNSFICFIYLADVVTEQGFSEENASFREARWFTRGWTLQELLAPRIRCFLDKDWEMIGYVNEDKMLDRGERSPEISGHAIEKITGISSKYLFNITGASVAERMSWAARRQTSRKEDTAYCLLGIFGIHMPMLYGEGGTRAFTRLQEEIIKLTDDCSLLSWGLDCQDMAGGSSSQLQLEMPEDGGSLLAPHPKYFGDCDNISPRSLRGFRPPSFSVAQRGWTIQLPVVVDKMYKHLAYGILACGVDQFLVAIPLISSNAVGIESNGRLDWNRDSWEDSRFHREYIRPDYYKPYLVLKEFLNGAKEEQIVIRRISEAWFNPRFVDLPIRVWCCPNFRVLTVYPPQPVTGGYLICLRSFPSGLDAPLASETSGKMDLVGQEIAVPAEEMVQSEKGRLILFVESTTARLLITFEYQATREATHIATFGTNQTGWQPSLDAPPCQIFKFDHGKHFDLESLQSLASSWNFSGWQAEKLIVSEELDLGLFGGSLGTTFFFSPTGSDKILAKMKIREKALAGGTVLTLTYHDM